MSTTNGLSSVFTQVTSNPTPTTTGSTTDPNSTIAGNFNTFLQLLTTQLQNQNPLDPLDTNQFTSQLVQFASVEQQINMNTQLTTLISLQQATQATSAMNFLGSTATVDGSTTNLTNSQATWTFSSDRPATGTVNITNSTGQLVYTGTYPISAGAQSFTWNGLNNSGTLNPDGAYTMSITAKDATGTAAAISTQVEGTVDAVDLTQNPPTLTIGGQSYPLSKIKQVVRPGLT